MTEENKTNKQSHLSRLGNVGHSTPFVGKKIFVTIGKRGKIMWSYKGDEKLERNSEKPD